MVPRSQQSGFSFVEILFAMLIVVTLYAVVLGPSKEYVQKQKLLRCAENLRKLHLTLSLYANEHDGAYPATVGARSSDEVFSLLVPRYSTDKSFPAALLDYLTSDEDAELRGVPQGTGERVRVQGEVVVLLSMPIGTTCCIAM